jgi:hypothetical protein
MFCVAGCPAMFGLEERKVQLPHLLLERCSVINIDEFVKVLYLLFKSKF